MKKRILCILLIFILAAAVIYVPASASSEKSDDVTILAFTSDIHHTSTGDNGSAKRLREWLSYITKTYGNISTLGICGDYGIDMGSTEQSYWNYAQRVFDNVSSLGIRAFYTTGNHEYKNGNYDTNMSEAKNYITRLGLAVNEENYAIICFGAASDTMEFPEDDINILASELEKIGKEKNIFVISHYPLHSFTYQSGMSYETRVTQNREKVIGLLNQYPNVFFIWGHNHSQGDPMYDKIITGKINEEDISFTYAAAGSMTDKAENQYAGNVRGKGLVVFLTNEGKGVSMFYTDINNEAFADWDNGNTAKYQISFDANGGSGQMEKAFGNLLFDLPECKFIPPAGMVFAGWSYTPDGKTVSGKIKMNSPLTLYAIWKQKPSFEKADSPQDGETYLIVSGNMALNLTENSGYINKNKYSYKGFSGKNIMTGTSPDTSMVTNDMLWKFTHSGNGWVITNRKKQNLYLYAEYYQNDKKGGALKLGDVCDTWQFEQSGGKTIMKSSNATSQSDKAKYMQFDTDSTISSSYKPITGNADLFTVRSSGSDITLYKLNENNSVKLTVNGNSYCVTLSGADKYLENGVVMVVLYDKADTKKLIEINSFNLAEGDIPEGKFEKNGEYAAVYWWSDTALTPYCTKAGQSVNIDANR